MKFEIRQTFTKKPEADTIGVTEHLFQLLQQTTEKDWNSLFIEFRLNLQSRILALSKEELVELQGKIRGINELESFILNIIKSGKS